MGYSEGPNLYAYLYNNPLIYFDPYGLEVDRFGVVDMSNYSPVIQKMHNYGQAINHGVMQNCLECGYSTAKLGLSGLSYIAVNPLLDPENEHRLFTKLEVDLDNAYEQAKGYIDDYYIKYKGVDIHSQDFHNVSTAANYSVDAYFLLKSVPKGIYLFAQKLKNPKQLSKAKNLLHLLRGTKASSYKTNSIKKLPIKLSKHAIQRMQERGITESMIRLALDKGVKYYDPACEVNTFILPKSFASGKSLLVSQNPETGVITTVIRGEDLVKKTLILIK